MCAGKWFRHFAGHAAASILLAVPCLFACALAFAAADAPEAQSSRQVRVHAALIIVPDGWKRIDQPSGEVWLTPPEDPTGKEARIVVAAPEPPRPTLRDHMEADLKQGRESLPSFQAEGEMAAGSHPAGYDMLSQLISFNANPLLPLRAERSYLLATHLDGGPEAPSQPIGLYAKNKVLLEKHRPTYEAFLRSARLLSRMTLAEGPAGHPPLTRFTVQQVADFLEWQLDVPFTAAQRDALQSHFVVAWKRGDVNEIKGVRAALTLRKELAAQTPERREAERRRLEAVVLNHWRQAAQEDGGGMAGIMVDVYDAAHMPLARGAGAEPPLTRQSADAMLESLHFMASKAAGREDVVQPTPAQRDEWANALAEGYAALPEGTKRELAAMPATWAALRAGWPELSSEQRATLAAEWARMEAVKPILARIDQPSAAERPGEAKAASAESLRQVNLHNQLSAYGALQKNYNILFR